MRTIVITGGSSGIGKALAAEYCDQAVINQCATELWLSGRNHERLESAARQLRERHPMSPCTVRTKVVDVRDRASMDGWLQSIDDASPIDVLIANAGASAGTVRRDGAESASAELHNIFDVNLGGVLNTIVPLLQRFERRRRGNIVLVSSPAGFLATSAYDCSKAAVTEFGHYLRARLDKADVKVSIVLPGFVRSGITEQNKFYMPMLEDAPHAAQRIRKGVDVGTGIIAFPFVFWMFVLIFRMLPPFLQHWIRRAVVSATEHETSHLDYDPDNNASSAKRD